MATLRTLQLYATGSATGTSVAQVTIPSAGTIHACQISLVCTSIVASTVVRIELSKVPTNQIATNGALDPFLECGIATNFVTSGLAHNGVPYTVPLNVPCRQGEIVYLHATVAGTVTYYFNGILWFK